MYYDQINFFERYNPLFHNYMYEIKRKLPVIAIWGPFPFRAYFQFENQLVGIINHHPRYITITCPFGFSEESGAHLRRADCILVLLPQDGEKLFSFFSMDFTRIHPCICLLADSGPDHCWTPERIRREFRAKVQRLPLFPDFSQNYIQTAVRSPHTTGSSSSYAGTNDPQKNPFSAVFQESSAVYDSTVSSAIHDSTTSSTVYGSTIASTSPGGAVSSSHLAADSMSDSIQDFSRFLEHEIEWRLDPAISWPE